MFYVGIVIAVVGGLIGSPLVRGWVRSAFSRDLDRVFEGARLVLILLGAVLSVTTYRGGKEAIRTLEEALQQKAHQITELESQARQASQGRAVTYTPNGAKTISEGVGSLRSFDDNPEVQVFTQMMHLQEQQDFPALLTLAEAQIAKTPTWLTPYLMQGFALAKLGRRDEAVEVLQFVRREAPYDPFYQQAAEWLKVLGAEHR